MSAEQRLWAIVDALDAHLDADVGPAYDGHALAQDWARVAKVIEEGGEAVDALIGVTGQNPRKGVYGDTAHLLDELADVAMTGIYAIQHFTKDRAETRRIVLARADHHAARVGIEP